MGKHLSCGKYVKEINLIVTEKEDLGVLYLPRGRLYLCFLLNMGAVIT